MNENSAPVTELNPFERAKRKAFDQPGGVYLTNELNLMFWHGDQAFGYAMTVDEATELARALLTAAATCSSRGN